MALRLACSAVLNPNLQVQLNFSKGHEKVKDLVTRSGVTSTITPPHISLHKGNWVKLICGASFEDVADIRNLSLVYTLAGVDCIDCAAEASVVNAVNEGIEAARCIVPIRKPWVMISVNDDEDLHFRKAEFDPDDCPVDCSRPCELVCPANAISQEGTPGLFKGGVMTERCYGCGRCFPVCPYDKISATTYIRDINTTAKLLKLDDVDAIEIHTSGRQVGMFNELWTGLGDSIDNLKLVAVSLPDLNEATISAMSSIYSIMETNLRCLNLWQLDGRPMSGDIGRGTTKEAIAFAKSLVSARDKPKGFLQLAGGTNAHTVNGLKKEGLFQTASIFGIVCRSSRLASFLVFSVMSDTGFLKQISNAEESEDEMMSSSSFRSEHALVSGVAFGGYARKIVGKVLNSMQSQHGHVWIENHPEHLAKAFIEALALVGTVKCYAIQQAGTVSMGEEMLDIEPWCTYLKREP